MSASDRARKRMEERHKRLEDDALSGLANALQHPHGRALLWWFYSKNADAEGEDGLGRRRVARELLNAARIANWEGVQIMREENERPLPEVRERMAEGEDE